MIKCNLFIFFMAGVIFGAVPVAFAQNAVELNTKGFALYEQEKYDQALEYFGKAALADPGYAYAHYNYACTAAILLGQNYYEQRGLIPEIFSHLETAISLRPQYREKMTIDPDLESVRKKYRFLVLAGIDPATESGFMEILTTVIWYGPRGGIFPASPVIKFFSDGKVEESNFSASGQDAGYFSMFGTYTIDGQRIRIQIIREFDGSKYESEYVFEAGMLRGENGEGLVLTDDPDVN